MHHSEDCVRALVEPVLLTELVLEFGNSFQNFRVLLEIWLSDHVEHIDFAGELGLLVWQKLHRHHDRRYEKEAGLGSDLVIGLLVQHELVVDHLSDFKHSYV